VPVRAHAHEPVAEAGPRDYGGRDAGEVEDGLLALLLLLLLLLLVMMMMMMLVVLVMSVVVA
jgi:hypothetical protein